MIKKKAAFLATLLAFVLVLSLAPSAFAAGALGSAQGKLNGAFFENRYYSGYSVAEYHSDFYANGFGYTTLARTETITTAPAGYIHDRTMLFYVVPGTNISYMVADSTSINDRTIYGGEYWVNQVWAKMTGVFTRIDTMTSRFVAGDSGAGWSFNTDASLDFVPGWPLP